MLDDIPPGLLWPGAAVGCSILWRLFRRRPILFFTVGGADYLDGFASGRLESTSWHLPGSARGSLVVAVAAGRLIIRPWFPFTLMFLPELYGLEYDVPLEQVREIAITSRHAGEQRSNVRLRIDLRDGRSDVALLTVRDPDGLVAATRKA